MKLTGYQKSIVIMALREHLIQMENRLADNATYEWDNDPEGYIQLEADIEETKNLINRHS